MNDGFYLDAVICCLKTFNFRNWQISNSRRKSQEVERSSFLSAANWRSRREKLDFYDFPFWMIYYQLAIEGGESDENIKDADEEGEKGREAQEWKDADSAAAGAL